MIPAELQRIPSGAEYEYAFHGARESAGCTVREAKKGGVYIKTTFLKKVGHEDKGCCPAIVPSGTAGITEFANEDGATACTGTIRFEEGLGRSSVVRGNGREKEREQAHQQILGCRVLQMFVNRVDRRAVAAALWRWRSEAAMAGLENEWRDEYRRGNEQVKLLGQRKIPPRPGIGKTRDA